MSSRLTFILAVPPFGREQRPSSETAIHLAGEYDGEPCLTPSKQRQVAVVTAYPEQRCPGVLSGLTVRSVSRRCGQSFHRLRHPGISLVPLQAAA